MSTPPTTTSEAELTVSTATDADWDDIFAADARAFLFTRPLTDDEQRDQRGRVSNADVVLVRDPQGVIGTPLVGVSMFYRMSMAVPGGAQADAAGLSWVSVAATHRRRGILRTMITELFERWEREDLPFAILTASEGSIYERYGFGPATFARDIEVAVGEAHMRQSTGPVSTVAYATADDVAAHAPDIHARWVATRPGALVRPATWWRPILADHESQKPPHSSGLHYLLHADGYAAYRIITFPGPSYAAVDEVFAVTDAAHSDLWRVLIGLDLVPKVTASVPSDDPLPLKLTNHRAVDVTGISDKMWLRILDVPRALGMRRYDADLDAVVEVTDKFRGRGGRFAITVRNGGAAVAPVDTEPTVRLDISVLGSIYLGGIRARTFASAGRLWTDSPATLAAVDAAFTTEAAPFAGTFF